MITKRESNERGNGHRNWLKSQHSFSFGHYYDPAHMGFGSLRVINEDHIEPAKGFPTHPHDNMEIITYVLSGTLAHKDSMGNESFINAGDLQIMSAGTGVRHSEYNASNDAPVHLLQIWILPQMRDTQPSYQQITLDPATLHNRFGIVVSPEPQEGILHIKQNARIFIGQFDGAQKLTHPLEAQKKYWLQFTRGTAKINATDANAGDGFAIENENNFTLETQSNTELLLFELT